MILVPPTQDRKLSDFINTPMELPNTDEVRELLSRKESYAKMNTWQSNKYVEIIDKELNYIARRNADQKKYLTRIKNTNR